MPCSSVSMGNFEQVNAGWVQRYMSNVLSHSYLGTATKASVTSIECPMTVFFLSMDGFKTYYTSLLHSYLSSMQLKSYVTDAFVTKCCIFSFFLVRNLTIILTI